MQWQSVQRHQNHILLLWGLPWRWQLVSPGLDRAWLVLMPHVPVSWSGSDEEWAGSGGGKDWWHLNSDWRGSFVQKNLFRLKWYELSEQMVVWNRSLELEQGLTSPKMDALKVPILKLVLKVKEPFPIEQCWGEIPCQNVPGRAGCVCEVLVILQVATNCAIHPNKGDRDHVHYYGPS